MGQAPVSKRMGNAKLWAIGESDTKRVVSDQWAVVRKRSAVSGQLSALSGQQQAEVCLWQSKVSVPGPGSGRVLQPGLRKRRSHREAAKEPTLVLVGTPFTAKRSRRLAWGERASFALSPQVELNQITQALRRSAGMTCGEVISCTRTGCIARETKHYRLVDMHS